MPGPQVSGPINTTFPSDVFGTHDAALGIDGQRSVASHAARNAIPNERRRHGMIVFTQNDGEYWSLNAAPWNGTDPDWSLLEIGAGTAVDVLDFAFPTPLSDWVMSHNLGARPTVTTVDENGDEFEGNIHYDTGSVTVHFDVPGGVTGFATLKRS